jgi:hypothetical protein
MLARAREMAMMRGGRTLDLRKEDTTIVREGQPSSRLVFPLWIGILAVSALADDPLAVQFGAESSRLVSPYLCGANGHVFLHFFEIDDAAFAQKLTDLSMRSYRSPGGTIAVDSTIRFRR